MTIEQRGKEIETVYSVQRQTESFETPRNCPATFIAVRKISIKETRIRGEVKRLWINGFRDCKDFEKFSLFWDLKIQFKVSILAKNMEFGISIFLLHHEKFSSSDSIILQQEIVDARVWFFMIIVAADRNVYLPNRAVARRCSGFCVISNFTSRFLEIFFFSRIA